MSPHFCQEFLLYLMERIVSTKRSRRQVWTCISMIQFSTSEDHLLDGIMAELGIKQTLTMLYTKRKTEAEP